MRASSGGLTGLQAGSRHPSRAAARVSGPWTSTTSPCCTDQHTRVKDGSLPVKTVGSHTSTVSVTNRLSLAELKAFKTRALAKVHQRRPHSHTGNTNPGWSSVTVLGWGDGGVPQHPGASHQRRGRGLWMSEKIAKVGPAFISSYTRTPVAQSGELADLTEQGGSLVSVANRPWLRKRYRTPCIHVSLA